MLSRLGSGAIISINAQLSTHAKRLAADGSDAEVAA